MGGRGKDHWHGGDFLVGNEGERATGEHAAGETPKDRTDLRMEIAEQFVGAPATNKTNNVGVDASAEEGVGTGDTEAPGGDIIEEEIYGRAKVLYCQANCFCNVGRSDYSEASRGEAMGQGSVCCCSV